MDMPLYLTWWMGALALSSVVVGFWFVVRRPLGVSGSWARIVMWREDQSVEAAEAPFRANPKMLQDALMRATIDHFGEQAVYEFLALDKGVSAEQLNVSRNGSSQAKASSSMHATFLAMLVIGALLASLANGHYQPQFNLGELHTQFFGSGLGYVMTLFFGGAMVGFGTQLAGGCTSGHGLMGCSRLVPASLIATMAFFGTAVVVSFILHFTAGAAA